MLEKQENNGFTILCVDDEENQLLLRKLLLQRAGYKVVLAESYRAGLAAFESNTVDLAVVDYWMGGGNGLQLASELKRNNRRLPVLILSAYSELPGETIGIADGWLTKGLSSEALLAKIAELLDGAGSRALAASQ